nr:magnesium/cobalt transporter CorA [Halococcus salsus]
MSATAAGVTERDGIEDVRAADGTTWIRATDTTPDERQQLRETFDIDPLATEDVIDTVRPKTEEYPDYTFVLFKTARLAPGDTAFRDEVETTPVGLFVGSDWLVTLSVTPVEAVERVWGLVHDGRLNDDTGADRIAYRVIDGMVEGYFDVLDELEDGIETIEEAVVTPTDTEVLESINEIRRELLSFRRLLWPSREAIGVLARGDAAGIRPDSEKYYRDVYDHLVQLVELTVTYRDLASGARDIYLNTLSQSTNEVMKTLTVVATVVLPLTLVTGLYGMNFETMPELAWPLAYPAVLLGMVVVVVILVAYFKRERYI